ncbi:MAG: FCD domain-containing protein [Bacteroidota bacterium]
MKIDNKDFASLVETWVLLEIESAKRAAQRRTIEDIEAIRRAQKIYADKVKMNEIAVEEDMMFHLAISDAGKNAALKSLLLTIMPDIIKKIIQIDIYKNVRAVSIIVEHEEILSNIIDQEPEKAASTMQRHLSDILTYSRRFGTQNGNGSNGVH